CWQDHASAHICTLSLPDALPIFSLIIQYHDKDRLVETLTPVVAEEWSHFERVLAELRKRGYGLGPQRKDEYVEALAQVIRKGGRSEEHTSELQSRENLVCRLLLE